MKITEKKNETTVTIDLSGRLIITELGALEHKIEALIRSGYRDFILNLAETTFIDSAGLGELTRVYSMVTRCQGRIRLANLTQRLNDLLTISKLATVYDVIDSDSEETLITVSGKA